MRAVADRMAIRFASIIVTKRSSSEGFFAILATEVLVSSATIRYVYRLLSSTSTKLSSGSRPNLLGMARRAHYRRTKLGGRALVRASAAGGSLSMRQSPKRNRPKPPISAAVRYWNRLPDSARYARAEKFGRVPINPAKLKKQGYRVEEDHSISGGPKPKRRRRK